NGLPFHHRFPCARTDVAEAEDGGAVRDDGDEVAAIRVLIDVAGVLRDLEARLCHAGRVGEGQIALRCSRFSGNDFRFAGAAAGVIFESVVAAGIRHGGGLYRPTESRRSDWTYRARPSDKSCR